MQMPDDYRPHPVTDTVFARPAVEYSSHPVESIWDVVAEFFPKDFLNLYEQLIEMEFSNLGRSVPTDPNSIPGTGTGTGAHTRSEQPDVRSVHRAPVFGPNDPIRHEQAGVTRARVDRKLRKLTREMRLWLSSASPGGTIHRCNGRCKRIAEPDWKFCPNCGGNVIKLK